jgi:alginate O-acetyltransferase complex protein AlgI
VVFDSYIYFAFLAGFFVVYHAAHASHRLQNALVLAGSCLFYGWWDVRFLGLLFVSAGIDYVAGLWLARPGARRRAILALSLTSNLGLLGVFKYYDFFAASFGEAFGVSTPLVHVALPVGISFYTFQSMSYVIDVYRRELEPERDAVTYFAFVSFFPHMVAGPIQRAHHLLGQLHRPRTLSAEHAREATWLLVYGFFLKVLVANPAAVIADASFTSDATQGAATIVGTLAFAVQIYCDFWGYSMIARGSGRLLGIEFIWNFGQPYFATSMQDFWRRWHISLSTWLRDYLYVPLGGNRKGRGRTYLNLVLTMLLGGLWHGAAWNFVFWGLLHGVALAAERLYRELGGPRLPRLVGWAGTMLVVLVGWFLFRCRSWEMISAMTGALATPGWDDGHLRSLATLALLAAPVVAIEVWQHRRRDLLAPLAWSPSTFAAACGLMIALTAVMFRRFDYVFIYFQF